MSERRKLGSFEIAYQLAIAEKTGLKVETSKLNGWTFSYTNSKEFSKIYNDIFEREEYYFQSKNNSPIIFDCGAHIGLATLYFKRLYPAASITSFEPNPVTFEILKLNMMQNGITGVTPINTALAGDELPRYLTVSDSNNSPWSWDDSCVQPKWNEPTSFKKVIVFSTRLSSYLTQPIDFLKLDIEGMENEVLGEIQDRMHLVKAGVVEFHGQKQNPRNNLDEVFAMLERSGFDILVKQNRETVGREKINRNEPYWLLINVKRRGW